MRNQRNTPDNKKSARQEPVLLSFVQSARLILNTEAQILFDDAGDYTLWHKINKHADLFARFTSSSSSSHSLLFIKMFAPERSTTMIMGTIRYDCL